MKTGDLLYIKDTCFCIIFKLFLKILKNWRQIKLNVFSTDLVEKNWCWELPVVNNGNSRKKVRLVFSKLETNWNNEYISLIYKKQSVFRKYDIGKKHKNTV